MSLASLSDAIKWARDNWDFQRTPPTKLHKGETEGIGLFYSAQFSHQLDAPINAHASITGTVDCYHPLLNRGDHARNCPECWGFNVKQHRTERYLWPMSVALTKLHNSLGPGRQPHPYALVILLAGHGWDARATADSAGIGWDRAEALFLMALRRLHGFYAEGPVSTRTSAPTWIDKSDSQRAAETAA